MRGKSPSYEAFLYAIAADEEVLRFLLTLPDPKRQPNLLLAAVRFTCGAFSVWPEFRAALFTHLNDVRHVMLTHATQTNEPGRCAALLPVLTRLPQPLALLEVGAAAGLCLFPDHYAYRYGRATLRPLRGNAPLFFCQADARTPIPQALPDVVWRAGLDLHPLDVTNSEHTRWLEALVWPEQTDRLQNLRAALEIAAAEKPRIVQGDLTSDALERLCTEAPQDATLVIFHTAVLAYVAKKSERAQFTGRAMRLAPYWIANEAPSVLADAGPRPPSRGRFLLSVNGAPVAWSDPHGVALDWIGPDA